MTSMTWDNLTADAEALRQTLGFDKWAVLGHTEWLHPVAPGSPPGERIEIQ